jgi:hypothetical protein
MLLGEAEAEAAEQLRLSGQDAGEQKKALEKFLFIIEGNGQQTGLERDTIGEVYPKGLDPAGRS